MSYLVLDISRYNPIEDYNAAATSVVGVIMRTGYRGRSGGTLTTDPLFETHYNGFVDTGIKIGFYWFTQAITEAEAIEEADYVYNLIKDKKCDFPVYIDTEYSGTDHTGRADALTAEERTPCVIAFCERMKELGYRAGIYASDSWYASNLILSDITSHEDYSLWVARYSENPPENVASYDGWQYTSNGTIEGYSNRVDLSNFYVDVAGWEKIDIGTKTITLDNTEYEYSGLEHKPVVTVEDLVLDTDYIVEYSNNINAGTATVSVTGIGEYQNTVKLEFTINPLDLDGVTDIVCDKYSDSDYYNLESLTVSILDETLVKDVDYIMITEDNIQDWDIATIVTITGIGNYTGTISETYLTREYTIDIINYDFTIVDEERVYNGNEYTPELTVNGNLVLDTDYVVEYIDNINAGEAKITIYGIGHYTGTIYKSFTISPLGISEDNSEITCGDPDENEYYNLDNLTISVNGVELIKDSDYIYESETVNGDVYEEAHITITGINNYAGTLSSIIPIGKAKIDINTVEITLSESSYEYTGEEIKPELVTNLEENVDYTAEYSSNIELGTGYISITGINDYYMNRTIEFIIVAKDFTDTVELVIGDPNEEGLYDLSNLILIDNGKVLEEDIDYSLEVITVSKETYIEATITINGIGNYTGSTQTVLNISKMDISDLEFVLDQTEFIYNGSEHRPSVSSEGLVEGTDYTVEYFDNINAGTATVYITGIGKYENNTELEFNINSLNLSNGTLTCGEPDDYGCYNIANIKLTLDDKVLESGVDYSMSLTSRNDTYYIVSIVTVNGIGNYTGSVIGEFNTQKLFININSIVFRMSQNEFVYDGYPIEPEVTSDLTEGEDYTINYIDNVDVGTGIIKIYGIGDYNGIKTLEFKITPLSIETAIITCGEKNQEGYYYIENLLVTFNGKALEKDKDYELSSYENIEDDFIITIVTITGTGNYTSTIYGSFKSGIVEKEPLSQGTEVTLVNVYIYARYGSKVPVQRKSGTFYIWKDDIKNNRIRITSKENMVGVPGQITGWVDVFDVDGSRDNINIGDAVIVNGITYTLPDGTGNTVNRTDVIMYVVDILDEDEFANNYALASAPNRSIQGYTSIKSLVKYIV